MKMSIREILITTVDRALERKGSEPFFPPGHNGPYNEPETPTRNSSHWIMLLAFAFKETGQQIYLDNLIMVAEYLISSDTLVNNQNFYSRVEIGKGVDSVNGVMGPAWVFEALSEASSVSNNLKYKNAAKNVFRNHKFSHRYGLWHRHYLNGEVGRIDQTFNHQLWFAAASSLLFDEEELRVNSNPINKFLDKLEYNFFCYESGLIYHPLIYKGDLQSKLSGLLSATMLIKDIIFTGKKIRSNQVDYEKRMFWKSVGYHSFNMSAFLLLKKNTKFHSFWRSAKFKQALSFMCSEKYFDMLNLEDHFGWRYNFPGLEVPTAVQLSDTIDEFERKKIVTQFLQHQFSLSFDGLLFEMKHHNYDTNTANARLYQLTRLPSEYLTLQLEIN